LVARNAVVRVVGELIAKVASLAFFITMARRLGPHGFGEFQFALALTGALAYLAGFGTDELLSREVARDRTRSGRLLSDAASLKLVSGVVMLGVAAAIAALGNSTAEGRAVVYVVGVGAMLEVLCRSWYAIFQGYERFELVSATLIVQRTLTAVVGIVVLLNGGGVVSAAAVYAGGALVAVFVAELWLRRLGVSRAEPSAARWPALVRAGVPIGLIGLMMTVLLRLDVTMLSFLADSATVGIYAVAFRLVDATQFIGSALAAAMLPWLARAEDHLARGFALGLKAVTAVLLPLGLAFMLFAGPVIELIYGNRFDRSVLPLRILGLTTLFYGINGFAALSLIARYHPGAYAKLLVPVIAVNFGLNLVLIPHYGADGAAVDALVSGALLAALALAQARTIIGHTDLAAALGGPLIAGAIMVAVVLVLATRWTVEATVGLLSYVGVLTAYERLVHPEDLRIFLSALPVSRSQADRTAA
jgi:O-antigen/teichoic acid export membrane protein